MVSDDFVFGFHGEHKGMPVFQGNRTEELVGVKRGWIEDREYRPPTALEPDRKDKVTHLAAVSIAFKRYNSYNSVCMPKAVAEELYHALGRALNLE